MCDAETGVNSEKRSFKNRLNLVLRTLLHGSYCVLCACVSAYGFFFIWLQITDEQRKKEPIDNTKRFIACYGTNWNYLGQTVFLFLALAHDVLEWTDKENSNIGRKIRYHRDVLFCGLVVPYTCFVFGMFWVLYAIDRELVFPAVYDEIIPWWFNQCVHTNILVLVVAENLLQARRKPTDEKWELTLNAGLGISYAIVYYAIYFIAGRWLYNVFGIMNWWQVCLFQILIWTSTYVFYRIQFPLNRLIHGPEPEMEKTEQKSQINEGCDEIREVNDKNGEIMSKHEGVNNKIEEYGTKNGFGTEKEVFATENKEVDKKMEGESIDSKLPFSSKSWSLKYRNMRNQTENTNL